MSDFVDMLTEMLPMHSSLQDKNNPLRKVLDYTVGEYMDNLEQPFDMLFLDTATGGWLDSFGRDYGIFRKPDESDDDYRTRIVYEKRDNLTANFLTDIYNAGLFSFREDFNVTENTLVSDNPYLSSKYIGVADEEVINILDSKYVINNGITWVNSEGSLDYLLNIYGGDILSEYSNVYSLDNLVSFFNGNSNIEKVKLRLPVAIYCSNMFKDCSSLVNVTLNLVRLSSYDNMFYGASNIETIDVTIPTDKVIGFKSYVLGLNLENLTSFIINGEEVDLS